MDPLLAGAIALLAMIALTFLGVPIAYALVGVAVVGNALLVGWQQTAMQTFLITWEMGTNFLLIAVPLFVFVGQLAFHTRIASDLYDCVYKWFGRLPGGIAVTATIASAAFGAVTGSSVAAVATMGAMVMPEMRRYGYDNRLATGSLSSAGTLAIMIPPSIPMVVYGLWTETSVGKLFIAGILPGILLTIGFCGWIVVRCLISPQMGPAGPAYPWGERVRALVRLLPTLLVFGVILGGIYGGVFTPTEASAIGAVSVIVVALCMRRLTWQNLKITLQQTGTISAMIYAILFSGVLMSRLLAQTDVTPAMVNFITRQSLNPYVVLFLFTIMYIFLGMILDTLGMIVLTLPFVFPVVKSLGFDPIWFGVYMTLMQEVAMLTPPIGLNVFVMAKIAPDVPMVDIFRGVTPFVIICLVAALLLAAFPQIALWLPSLM
jgi:tripartite ATP-independent transporter DctM subunit